MNIYYTPFLHLSVVFQSLAHGWWLYSANTYCTSFQAWCFLNLELNSFSLIKPKEN